MPSATPAPIQKHETAQGADEGERIAADSHEACARILVVAWQNAAHAAERIGRSQEEVRARAQQLRVQLDKPGAEFAALERQHSEDSSAERGGDLGSRGRGIFVPAFEDALFGLRPDEISDVVETELGFHLIQRLPD